MPTIQSRKYDNVQFVDAETWREMQEKGIARRFKVIDDGDMAETVIPAPESIINFMDNDIPKHTDKVEKVLSREEIKAALDEKEIEYNTRATTDKLLQLLNN